jgi:phosphate transport system substrate-binding protein
MLHPRKLIQLLLVTTALSSFLSPAFAASKELRWTGCGISKLGFMQDLADAYEEKSGVKILLEGGGATKGLRTVADGSSHLGGSCRLPLIMENKDGTFIIEEKESRVKVIPVGWDALVVIANKANDAASAITQQQLKDVLTGKITNWKELGAADQPITLYVRNGKISGVGLTLRQQLFNNPGEEFRRDATYLASSGKIEKAVEADPYALAVSGISSSRHREVKMLKLDGIEPSMKTLKEGKYPLYRLLFLVAPHNLAEHPELQDFIQFALSPKGQRTIKQAGTLPYHQAINLIFTGTTASYLHTIDMLSDRNIYTLTGK